MISSITCFPEKVIFCQRAHIPLCVYKRMCAYDRSVYVGLYLYVYTISERVSNSRLSKQ